MSRKLRLNVHVPSGDGTQERSLALHTDNNISWANVTILLEGKLKISNKNWAFQYFDDEDDMVFGKTEVEWSEAVKTASENRGDHDVMSISAFPLSSQLLSAQESKCTSSSNSPCQSKQLCLGKSLKCCDYERPLPDQEPDTSGAVGPKIVNPTLNEYKYSAEALRAVALPLGPIGGGSIAVAGDGGLRQWQISNAVNHLAHVPFSFFAVRVDQGGKQKSVVLQSNTWYDQTGFKPANYITDHVVPQASIDLLKALPGVKTLEITAKYPTVEVDYLSDEVPVKIHLEAFNPCIPLDSKNSGIPMIIFNFTVTNPSSAAVKVSLLGSQQNIAGWDGEIPITKPSDSTSDLYVLSPGFGGNVNSLFQTSDMYGIDMSNPSLPEKSPFNGHVAMSVLTKEADQLRTMLQYNSVKEMWKCFTGSGLPGQGQPGSSPAGATWVGAVSCAREIQPNSSENFTFLLAWHFPHRFVNWDQSRFGIANDESQFYIGNQYNNVWKNVNEVLDYTVTKLPDLTTDTINFRDAMFDSKSPWQLIDSAAGRVSVVRSPTCMWLGDGRLYGFEGCKTSKGCCPMNCTHVWNYEMTVAKCFPDLERTMRDIDLKEQMTPSGVVVSRSTVPLELRRVWTLWPNYEGHPTSRLVCTDGEIGTVLKTYREILQGAPQDWFDSVWPDVKLIMYRWMNKLDGTKDGGADGMIYGPQPCTYDDTLWGVNVFTGSLYLCALRAAEEMAKLQKDTLAASAYRERFEMGTVNLDKACYHTDEKTKLEWYIQPGNQAQMKGKLLCNATFVDCLIGQWWAQALNLGDVLDKDHVISTLKTIFAKNHTKAFDPDLQKPRKFFDQHDAGMYICKWPDDVVPPHPMLYHAEGAWSSLEYEFAALCLYYGVQETPQQKPKLLDIAMQVLTEAREKYDGTRRSPWNEIECGDHYTRPMSSMLLFEAISGQTWLFADPGRTTLVLGFGPRLNPTDFCGFFILGTCWGQFSQNGDEELKNGTAQLSIKYGDVRLAQFQLHTSHAKTATASKNGKPLVVTATQGNGLNIVFSSSGLTLTKGDTLLVTFHG